MDPVPFDVAELERFAAAAELDSRPPGDLLRRLAVTVRQAHRVAAEARRAAVVAEARRAVSERMV